MPAWKQAEMGTLCSIKSGKSNAQDADANGPYAFFDRSKSVKRSTRYLYDCEALIIPGEGAEFLPRHFVGKFDLHQRAYALFDFSPDIDVRFLYYYLIYFKDWFVKVAVGATVKSLRLRHFENLPVVVPPLAEQKRIVAILDAAFVAIDTATAHAEKNLANARELFESHLNTVYSEEDSLGNEFNIADLGQIFDGPHATPKTVESGPVFLGIKSLDRGRLDLSNTRHVTDEDFVKWTKRVTPRSGDVVFSYETKLGTAAVIPDDLVCCLGRRMALIRLDQNRIDPRFYLYQYLSPPYQQYLADRYVRGATVDRLSLSEFPSYTMRVPSRQVQLRLVATHEAVRDESEALATLYTHRLTLLAELKQSILQKAFTGELTAGPGKEELDSRLRGNDGCLRGNDIAEVISS